MFNFLAFIFSFFDPRLVPWIFVLNVLGYWAKRCDRLPKWSPPLPVLIFASSFVICALFGWLTAPADCGVKDLILSVVYYGLGNGLLIGFISTFGYDIVHGVLKQRKAAKEAQDVDN